MTEPNKAGRKPAKKQRNATHATPKKGVSDAEIVKAILKADGLISVAARALGIERSTLYRRANASPVINEAIADAREAFKDEAESALQKAVRDCESWAVCFYLKTQAKDRGYIERQELDHSGNLNLGTPEQIRERLKQAGVTIPEGTP